MVYTGYSVLYCDICMLIGFKIQDLRNGWLSHLRFIPSNFIWNGEILGKSFQHHRLWYPTFSNRQPMRIHVIYVSEPQYPAEKIQLNVIFPWHISRYMRLRMFSFWRERESKCEPPKMFDFGCWNPGFSTFGIIGIRYYPVAMGFWSPGWIP